MEWLSDKELIDMLNITNQIGIAMSILTIISECLTFADASEHNKAAMDLPDRIDIGMHRYKEAHNAIVVIVIQIFVTIPWRIFACRVTRGVMDAIECVETLKFKASYGSDALRILLPDTGLMHGVGLAHESDIPRIAELYCESFRELFSHIGLDPAVGPEVIESQWRAKGRTTMLRWLNRVGVIRNESGIIIAMLSLQLPGDVAAYERAMQEMSVYSSLQNMDESSRDMDVSTASSCLYDRESELSEPAYTRCCAPEFFHLCLINAFRFRYKHAILTDHVCTPGEAYVDFLCVDEKMKNSGIGTRLMKWAEQSAEKLGCGRIALSVWGPDRSCGSFYETIGYRDSEHRSDYITFLMLQIIFCFRNRFFDYEKPLGQESGIAIHSSKYGFTSDVSTHPDSSTHSVRSWGDKLNILNGFRKYSRHGLFAHGRGNFDSLHSNMDTSTSFEIARSNHRAFDSDELPSDEIVYARPRSLSHASTTEYSTILNSNENKDDEINSVGSSNNHLINAIVKKYATNTLLAQNVIASIDSDSESANDSNSEGINTTITLPDEKQLPDIELGIVRESNSDHGFLLVTDRDQQNIGLKSYVTKNIKHMTGRAE
jgi:GNAT superfamily N-acetyltransferase